MTHFSLSILFSCLLISANVYAKNNISSQQETEEKTVDAKAPYDNNNIFARIIRQKAPADIVYEDEYALAFHTIDPKVKVHILVIPKGPYTNFNSFTEKATPAEQIGLLKAITKVSHQMGVSNSGFRLNTNTGHHGGQTVPHLHFHVLGGESVPGIGK